MKRKVSTVIDETLFRRVKIESARQGRQMSDLIGEALERYLSGTSPHSDATSVVERTWNAIPAPAALVRQILEEEDGLLDA